MKEGWKVTSSCECYALANKYPSLFSTHWEGMNDWESEKRSSSLGQLAKKKLETKFFLNEKKFVVFDLIFTNYVEQNAFNLLFSGTLSSSRPKSALFMSAAGSIIDVAVRM